MKNLFRVVIFPFIAGMYTSQANSANSFAFLWVSYAGGSGNINYTGPAILSIEGTVNSLNTGTMEVKYNECNYPDNTSSFYSATDKWVFAPSKISIDGKDIGVSVLSPPDGFTFTKYNDYNLVKQDGEIGSNFASGNFFQSCSAIGTTKLINYTYPKFYIKFDISKLSVGSFTGTLPLKLAYAEYYGQHATDIIKFPDELAFQYTTNVEIPYSINITNKCTMKENISLSHGHLPIDKAEGNIATDMLDISCYSPVSLKLSVQSRSLPTPGTSYSNGIGVGLGNGWASEVKIGDSGLSDVSLTKTISVPQGGISMPITSTLRENGNISSGNISGNLVLSISMD